MFKPNQKVKLACSVEQFIEEAYHGLYTYKENLDLYGMATVEKFERGYLFPVSYTHLTLPTILRV